MKLAILFLCCALLSACSLSLQGNNGLTVAGNSTSNVVTLALDGTVVRGVLTDSGNATGLDNWLSMLGAGNVTISASGSTITISCVSGEGGGGNATYALDSDKLDGEHGSYYLSTTGTAADSTLFYGFTALQWTNAIDNQVVGGIEAVDIVTDSGVVGVADYGLSIVGAGSVSTEGSGSTITVTGKALGFASGCFVYLNGAQSVAFNEWVLVALDTELFDVGSEFSTVTSLFTAVSAGYYMVTCRIGLGLAAGKYAACEVRRNGNATIAYCFAQVYSSGTYDWVFGGNDVIYLAAGDTLGLWMLQGVASSKALYNGVQTYNSMKIYRIA